MIKKSLFIMLILSLQWFNCSREKQPLAPRVQKPNNNPVVKPQIDISWPSLADSPWPMHHHDPQSTGRSQYRGPQLGRIKWAFNVGAAVGTSTAIGADSTLYFGSSYEMASENEQATFLYALSFPGSLKWKFRTHSSGAASLAAAPIVARDGIIYIGSRDRRLYAVQPNGQLKWIFEADDQIEYAGLNIGLDGVIYFVDWSKYLYAVNPDGSLRWKRDGYHLFMNWSTAGISFSPEGSTLYLGLLGTAASDTVTGLAAVGNDGGVKWIFNGAVAVGTPLVDNSGNIFFVGAYGKGASETKATGIYSLTPEGQLRWNFLCHSFSGVDLTMDYNGNVYFGIAKSGTEFWLVSTDNEGNLRWEYNMSQFGPLSSSLICDVEGTIYAAAWHQNLLFALSSDGYLKWQVEIGPVGYISPALGDGLLFIGTWYIQNNKMGKEFCCIE